MTAPCPRTFDRAAPARRIIRLVEHHGGARVLHRVIRRAVAATVLVDLQAHVDWPRVEARVGAVQAHVDGATTRLGSLLQLLPMNDVRNPVERVGGHHVAVVRGGVVGRHERRAVALDIVEDRVSVEAHAGVVDLLDGHEPLEGAAIVGPVVAVEASGGDGIVVPDPWEGRVEGRVRDSDVALPPPASVPTTGAMVAGVGAAEGCSTHSGVCGKKNSGSSSTWLTFG
mmetsp:Transcript_40983/g.128479  ORF Transcript_40983/g.128479 Transcript_40983/m.128479 type:complete len:227 (-) Transcript_40983:200-880(-)